jgi:hypothetical protein
VSLQKSYRGDASAQLNVFTIARSCGPDDLRSAVEDSMSTVLVTAGSGFVGSHVMAAPQDLARENERPRLENRILKRPYWESSVAHHTTHPRQVVERVGWIALLFHAGHGGLQALRVLSMALGMSGSLPSRRPAPLWLVYPPRAGAGKKA